MEKIKLILASVQAIYKRFNAAYKQKIQYKYFFILALFLGVYIFIFYTGFSDSGRNDYQVYAIGDTQPVTSFNYEVAGRTYDPETKKYKLDLWLSSDNAIDLYSIQAKATTVAKGDPEKKLSTKVVRTDGNFVSFVISDVPKNFEFIRTDIVFKDESTDGNSSNEEPLEVRLYSKESGTKADSFEANQKSLIADSVDYEIKKTRIKIKEDEKEVSNKSTSIRKLERKNEKLESDSKFQLGEELENTQTAIDSNSGDIRQLEESIKEKESQIGLAKEKIKMLKKKAGK
ncbi:hypothetical protein [Enterococcus sp. AZ072]|uniref:hypothetical protein n=1 Tax=unclassified Enterococcus TaxID=2608891 RepID=UPI003D2E43EC